MAMSEQFTKVGDGMLVRAPGKINISLLVKGKRPDGYHDIESIMAKIGWYDEIVIENKSEIRNSKSETIQNSNFQMTKTMKADKFGGKQEKMVRPCSPRVSQGELH